MEWNIVVTCYLFNSQSKIHDKFQVSFCDWYHAKVLPKRFHLNGHTMGFRPQTQKLELHHMSSLLTLGMTGLIDCIFTPLLCCTTEAMS